MNQIIKPDSGLPALEALKELPEEVLWQQNFNSRNSIETYGQAVQGFINFLGISGTEELRSVGQAHVIAFKKHLQAESKSPRTINNRLSALSSLFTHLIETQVLQINPVAGVKRMKLNENRVEAKVLTPLEVRAMLDAPDIAKLKGLRDRALLGILFYTGCRASEVCKLKIKNYYEEQGYKVLDFEVKGGKKNRMAINKELEIYIDEYLSTFEHQQEKDCPLLLPAKKNQLWKATRPLSRSQINRVWRKYALMAGIEGTYPHSGRATFITQALENGCPIEAVQKTVGHAQIKTTQAYDKRLRHYRDSASFSVRY